MHVFLLGATGYVGGTLLRALKEAYPEFKITALVRSPSALELVAAVGANPIQGTFAEHAKLTELSAASDIVINAADSDDAALTAALLLGLRQRQNTGRGVGTLLHVGGVALFLDGRQDGRANPDGKVWDDGDADAIKTISPDMIHGPVDCSILKAGEEGYMNTYIVCPGVIHGVGTGPTTQTSIFYKFVIKSILAYGKGFVIGEGSNIIDAVHINDLISLLKLIVNHAVAAGGKLLTSTPHERYYIAGTSTITFREILTAITAVVHRRGLVPTMELVPARYEDVDQFRALIAANAPTRCRRAHDALGWNATEKRFNETVDADIEHALDEAIGQKVMREQPWTEEEITKQAGIARQATLAAAATA